MNNLKLSRFPSETWIPGVVHILPGLLAVSQVPAQFSLMQESPSVFRSSTSGWNHNLKQIFWKALHKYKSCQNTNGFPDLSKGWPSLWLYHMLIHLHLPPVQHVFQCMHQNHWFYHLNYLPEPTHLVSLFFLYCQIPAPSFDLTVLSSTATW